MIQNQRLLTYFELHLPVTLFRLESSMPIAAETLNISKNEFLCSVEEPFVNGERFRFIIPLPHPLEPGTAACAIDGEGEVLAVITDSSQPPFKINCYIRRFRVIASPSSCQCNAPGQEHEMNEYRSAR